MQTSAFVVQLVPALYLISQSSPAGDTTALKLRLQKKGIEWRVRGPATITRWRVDCKYSRTPHEIRTRQAVA
eukprot:2517638-Rhodomonas_salina.1